MTDPSGGLLSTIYDAARRLTSLVNSHVESTLYAYDAAAQLISKTLANGTKVSMIYDPAGRQTRLTNLTAGNAVLSQYEYLFDGVGNRTSVSENGGAFQFWTNDPRQWLSAENSYTTSFTSWDCLSITDWNLLTVDGWYYLPLDGCPSGEFSYAYTYDVTGNRTLLVDELNGNTTYTYDSANRLLTAVNAVGITTYTYDANGNRSTAEDPTGDIATYTWDFENRLIQVEHPSGEIVTSTFDPDAHRIAEDDGVATTQYIYDENNLLQQRDDLGVVDVDYTYVPQEYALFVSQHQDSESQFYQTNGIHDVTQLTDTTGAVTDDYSYDAWRNFIATTGTTDNLHTGNGELGFQLTPQLSSEESSYYAHYRILTQGRFLSQDPIESTTNLYPYALNNPINLVDPSGCEEIPKLQENAPRDHLRWKLPATGVVQSESGSRKSREGAKPRPIEDLDENSLRQMARGATNDELFDSINFYRGLLDLSTEDNATRRNIVKQIAVAKSVLHDRSTIDEPLEVKEKRLEAQKRDMNLHVELKDFEKALSQGSDLHKSQKERMKGEIGRIVGEINKQSAISGGARATASRVARMSFHEKLFEVFERARTDDRLDDQTKEKLRELANPITFGIIVGIFLGYKIAHFYGVAFLLDIGLAAIGAVPLAERMYTLYHLVDDAVYDEDLDFAVDEMVDTLSGELRDFFLAVLIFGLRKAAKGKKEGSPNETQDSAKPKPDIEGAGNSPNTKPTPPTPDAVAPSKASLLEELAQGGVKHTPENIVSIAKDASGKVVFLEKGGAKAGLQHIVQEHAGDFARRGIPEAQIPDAVMAAATRGKQVGMQGTRPIFEVEFGGKTQRIAVTVGNNGFIVGANPAP